MELLSVNNQVERSSLTVEGGSLVYQRDTQEMWVSLAPVELQPERLADMPESKEQFGFEECEGRLYAVCGVTTGGLHSKSVYAYDPAADTWVRKADAPIAAQSPIMRTVAGKLYLIGGYRSDIPLKYDTCYEYDPATDVWTQRADMPTAREDMASAVVGGKVYIFGGLTNPAHTLVASVDIYDPSSDTWETRTWTTPRALGDFGAAYGGKVYLIGGTADMSGYGTNLKASRKTTSYDPATEAWNEGALCPSECCYGEVEELGGRLYVVTGVRTSTTDYTASILVYDPVADEWRNTPGVYAARGIGLCKCGGFLFMAGGFDGTVRNYLYRIPPRS